ncbi:MAG: hypothetical protein MJ180_03830, partial [Candidatus Gastranaerophilales bacterium]|nr:hypothetical protein [Candidatus Gastranaerophilales bacterium]
MSDSKLSLNSPIVGYGVAAAAGAAVGSVTPSAINLAKKGLKTMPRVDAFVRTQYGNAVSLKNGLKTRLVNAARALFATKPLAEGAKPSALRNFFTSSKELAVSAYKKCADLAKPITSRPMAKWAVIGAA